MEKEIVKVEIKKYLKIDENTESNMLQREEIWEKEFEILGKKFKGFAEVLNKSKECFYQEMIIEENIKLKEIIEKRNNKSLEDEIEFRLDEKGIKILKKIKVKETEVEDLEKNILKLLEEEVLENIFLNRHFTDKNRKKIIFLIKYREKKKMLIANKIEELAIFL